MLLLARGSLRTITLTAAISLSGASFAVDSHDRAAFALGYQFTSLYESFRVTIKKTPASGKEGLRKSLRKKVVPIQAHVASLGLKTDLGDFILDDLQSAKSLADYNVALGRLRRNLPSLRARACYDLGRTFALFEGAYHEADTVSEHPFFGIRRNTVVNGVRATTRTKGKFFELGHELNAGLQRLKFTDKRLNLELNDLSLIAKTIKALMDESNAYFGTSIVWK